MDKKYNTQEIIEMIKKTETKPDMSVVYLDHLNKIPLDERQNYSLSFIKEKLNENYQELEKQELEYKESENKKMETYEQKNESLNILFKKLENNCIRLQEIMNESCQNMQKIVDILHILNKLQRR